MSTHIISPVSDEMKSGPNSKNKNVAHVSNFYRANLIQSNNNRTKNPFKIKIIPKDVEKKMLLTYRLINLCTNFNSSFNLHFLGNLLISVNSTLHYITIYRKILDIRDYM